MSNSWYPWGQYVLSPQLAPNNFPSNIVIHSVGVKLCWGFLTLTWLALVWLPYPVSHFDAVCFLFPYPLRRISNWFNGFRSFTPPPPFPPNKQRTSNSKLIGTYLMYGFMRLSYLTISRYTVARAVVNTEPLNKTHS